MLYIICEKKIDIIKEGFIMANRFAELTDDKDLKMEFQKIDDLLSKEENKEKLSKMTTPEEVISFFEENGYTYSDEAKKEIMELSKHYNEGELTEDDLAEVSGGWSWGLFGAGTAVGGLFGGAIGCVGALCALTGPVGWIVGGCALAGAAAVGIASGLDD